MKLYTAILTAFLLGISCLSCVKDEVTNDSFEIEIMPTGCWTEIEDPTILQFAGSNHTFCFLSDSVFTLELVSWTDDVIDINVPNEWTDYVKGSYLFTNDSFVIEGSYMNADFTEFVNNRFGEGQLSIRYDVMVISENEIILDNDELAPHRSIRLYN